MEAKYENGVNDSCYLLKRGADVNVKDKTGNSPLHVAIRKRNTGLIEQLLDKGADKEAKNNGESPLLFAVRYQSYGSCDILLDRGADVNVRDKSGSSPLLIAIRNRSIFGDRPRHNVKIERCSIIKKLLDKGADIEAKGEDGDCPLLIALRNNSYDLCDLLLDRGANVNVKDKYSNSPLHIAISYRNIGIIEKLLEKGADIEAKNGNNDSPLLIAVRNNNYDSCDLLLDRGADVNLKDKSGNSPLQIAIKERSTRLIEKLLDKGADMEAKDENGYSPLLKAVRSQNYYLCDLLLNRGADVNVKDLKGQTPLHIANCCYNTYGVCCRQCIIQLLLLWGGSMFVMDINGKTPMGRITGAFRKLLLQLKKHVIKFKPKEFKMHLELGLECELNKLCESPNVSPTISTLFDDEEYLTFCLEELEKMKIKKFGCHSLYYYYTLCKRDDPTYIENDTLEHAIETNILALDFPIYASLVKVTFLKAKHRILLLDASQQVINLPLPNEISRKILSYLSNDDLRTVIESSELNPTINRLCISFKNLF